MTTIVIMPGGFHPFHAGHYALYQSAQRTFPDADVYVAATDDVTTRPFPFQVKEKLAQLAGVNKGRFMRVKSPFKAEEITSPYNPAKDTLIFVRSEKDSTKPPQPGGVKKDGSPSYLQPLLGAKKLEPFARHAYMAYLPTVEFGPGMTSATEIRTAWPQLDERRKTALVMSLYPRTQGNAKLAATVVGLLDAAIDTQGVAEAVNPDILNKKFKHTQEIGDYTYTAHVEQGRSTKEPYPGAPITGADTPNPYYVLSWLKIRCFDGDKRIGSVVFEIHGNEKNQQWLESYGTSVDKSYEGTGIASTMYAYAKMLGNDIKPSKDLSFHGQRMWAGWRKSGASRELRKMSTPVQGVAEGGNPVDHEWYRKQQERKDKAAKRQDQQQRQSGVAEGAPIIVAQAPIDVRNPKKAPQPYRNQGDIVPPTNPPSTEKRGVKGRAGQRPMPKYDENNDYLDE